MPTLNELKRQVYSDQTGITDGALPDLERQWLYFQLGEGSSDALPSLWMKWLYSLGYTSGTFNERLFSFLGDLGYTGSLTERWYDWMADGAPVVIEE